MVWEALPAPGSSTRIPTSLPLPCEPHPLLRKRTRLASVCAMLFSARARDMGTFGVCAHFRKGPGAFVCVYAPETRLRLRKHRVIQTPCGLWVLARPIEPQ